MFNEIKPKVELRLEKLKAGNQFSLLLIYTNRYSFTMGFKLNLAANTLAWYLK